MTSPTLGSSWSSSISSARFLPLSLDCIEGIDCWRKELECGEEGRSASSTSVGWLGLKSTGDFDQRLDFRHDALCFTVSAAGEPARPLVLASLTSLARPELGLIKLTTRLRRDGRRDLLSEFVVLEDDLSCCSRAPNSVAGAADVEASAF